MNTTYRNVTGETLSSRNPRFVLAPGASIELEQETISHIVRGWIRTGALEIVAVTAMTEAPAKPIQAAPIAAHPAAKKPVTKKPVTKKPAARKPAAKKVP